MKRIYFLLILLCLSNFLYAATKYWVGTTGNYSDGANWNTLSNGSGSSGAPINTDDIVIDRNAAITIDGNYSPSSVWIINNAIVVFTNVSASARTYTIGGGVISPAFKIEAGSSLNVTGSNAITIAPLTGSPASIFGTLDFTGSNSKMDNSFGTGVTTIRTGGKVRYGGLSGNGTASTSTLFLEAGSTYEVYKNGGSFPTATYDPNSLLLNTGAIANPALFLMNSATGSYGNYEFNAPAYTNSSNAFNGNFSFNNFTITDDGIGRLVYSTNSLTAYALTINGNLNIAAGAALDICNATSGSQATTLLVKGNLLNNGLISESNANTGSVIEIGGSTATTFSTVANGITNDVSLIINKSGGAAVSALTDISLPNSSFSRLTLTSGHIDMLTANKTLFIQNPAFTALIGGTVGSHIIGKLKRSSNQVAGYGFPVSNNAAQLAKATITTTNTNSTDWTVDFSPANANAASGLTPGLIEIVSSYSWNILRAGATPSNADFVTFFYGGLTTSQVIIPAQVKVVRWNGASWSNLGGVDGGGSVDNALGSTGGAAPGDPVTVFGQFAIGGIIGTLPISIEYFNGVRNNNEHLFTWKVNCTNASNINLILERSADGRNFNSIYSIVADAVRCRQAFNSTDANPLSGINYYRIKLVEADGKVSYSKTIGLLNKQTGIAFISMSPNPVINNNPAILNIASAQNSKLSIIITDLAGRRVLAESNRNVIAGNNQLPLNLSMLSSGTYQITIQNEEGNKTSIPFIKD